MSRTTISTNTNHRSYGLPLLLALIAAGLVGNYFNFPIFLSVDFLFGSIFAMLALQFFGLRRGILAAAIIATVTYPLWNHPYNIIVLTAEAAIVGWLMERRKTGMILADTLFWLFIGMPLVYLFYHLVMQVPLSSCYIVMIKQALNGIANALIARLIFTGYTLRTRSTLTSYSEIIYNLMAFFVLCPALIMLAIYSRADFNENDRQIRTSLIQDSGRLSLRLETWVLNRKTAILTLAEMAASRSPQQMQAYLELSKKSDVNFLGIRLHDKEAMSTAYYPLPEGSDESARGNSPADNSFIPILKQSLNPMLSEVFLTRIGVPSPRVAVLAPVVIQGAFGGHVIGILDLRQIQEHLDKNAAQTDLLYTLLDKNSNVIMTNRPDQKVMTHFVRDNGKLTTLENGISQWIPTLPPNTPVLERWRKSFYVAESIIGDLAEWRLVLEQPVAPFQKMLYDQYTDKLTLLFLILLVALALAELVSRKMVVSLAQLRTLTHELPLKLAKEGKDIAWPTSGIKEADHLIRNFREMADSLSEQFIETRQINESLEQRVEERTTELQESEARYRNFFEKNRSVMLIIDSLNSRIIDANPAACEYYGWSRDEMTTKKIFEINTSSQAEVAAEIEIAKNQGRNHFFFKHRRADGMIRDVEVYTGPIQTKGKTVLMSIIHDITERKQTEEKLKKSEALYHSLVETSQDLIWQCDAEGRYTYLNLAWEQVFGYELHEMLGKRFTDFQSPDNAARSQIQFKRILEGHSVSGFESTHIGKSGKEIHLVFNALFTCDEQGNIIGTSGTAYDITPRKQLEKTLLQAKAAAESANIAKSSFLANMSHEIRTPMNGIIGLIELLLGTELTEEQRNYAELVKLSSRNLMQLISDILDLSKIEAHKIELESRGFDLQAETSATISLLSLHAQENGLELYSQIDPDVPLLVKGDAGRLRQIITNLIGNAIKFSDEGSVTLRISKDAEDETYATLRFQVCDNGIGIATDKQKLIFEQFTQGDGSTTRKYGGTGLGLSIARELAELMGGSVGVESVEGEGATFWFTVVLEKQAEASALLPAPPRQPQKAAERILGNQKRAAANTSLLLVEDDLTNQLVTWSILTKSGYQVDVANNGREALKLLEENDYALVLMDCMMPVLNGYDATATIRDQASAVRNHAVPVIALTAKAMQEDHDICRAAGMDDYLAKPLDVTVLLAMLEKWTLTGSGEKPVTKGKGQATGNDAQPEHTVIFDQDTFVRRNMGDLELSGEVASTFIKYRPEYIESIRTAVTDRDTSALRQSAHKLKGSAANISLSQLSSTAAMIEACAEAGDLEKAAELLPDLELSFGRAVEALRKSFFTP